MTDISLRLKNELRRLIVGPSPDEKPGGIGIVRFNVSTANGAEEVLSRAKEVLRVVDNAVLDGWTRTSESVLQLPEWFTSACAPPMSDEQAEEDLARWRRLPLAEKAKESTEGWTLDAWLYWMEADNRQWFWWDAAVLGDQRLATVAIEVEGWPFPWGSLGWLLRAAGASAVESEQ